MEKGLLIVITIMTYAILLSSIFTAIVVAKESKKQDIVKKTLQIMGVVTLVIVLIVGAFGISTIKPSSSTTSTEETVDLAKTFNEVSLDEYLELVKGSEKSIVLIARPTCSYCEKFAPILKQAMEDMNLTVNYIDTDKLSEDDWTTFSDSLDFLKNEEWGTPTVLIVQNGDSIAENQGYVELDTIKKFFTDNGFGK